VLAGKKGAAQVVFVLGPVECEKWDRASVAALRRDLPVLLNPPLRTLAGVLAEAEGYAGNDSGVSHLAAAVGAPTVALFGPTRPEHFAPVGPKVRIVHADSLKDIPVARVVGALSEVRVGSSRGSGG
jgi:ADP-heptose:LPS heptosyltransferase